tara:strand:+ start:37 stop:270 length:234 start_codon:yes stop_codon:yes gene_type:complete
MKVLRRSANGGRRINIYFSDEVELMMEISPSLSDPHSDQKLFIITQISGLQTRKHFCDKQGLSGLESFLLARKLSRQ